MTLRLRLSTAAAAVSLAAFGVVGVSASPASADPATCFGYTGEFNETGARFVDWIYGPDECFGVAPSGSIWHTWAGAGGWKEMPGNGHAYAIFDAFENSAGKSIKVITANDTFYCSYLDYATNTWGAWYRTYTDHC
ncbi:hypothetical protein [Streptomyces sp. GQFP]|uniref:hypothetical protein n=1 Tax=Streptomyces sp. GQFP TaxID=2907545 RepID=UPI001F3236CE|nr:hypothetical protein [Streptomyces sp. GQFP]UIX28558.1 hypothetical protein LUX31_00120 [Streptomyces sp. GQFP]